MTNYSKFLFATFYTKGYSGNNGTTSLENTLAANNTTGVENNVFDNGLVNQAANKGITGKNDAIDISQYESIKRKELQDARSLKYPKDITRTYEKNIINQYTI